MSIKINRCIGGILVGVLLFITAVPVFAQLNDFRQIFWYYGSSQYGIRFNKSDFTANLDSLQNPAFGIGGSAVATDPVSGDLLFYSDGSLVYDRSHQLISNYTPGLNGNTTGNQPVAVTPLPGTTNRYLLIGNSADALSGGSIFSAEVDMNIQGNAPDPLEPAYGQMLGPSNTNLTSNASEGMIVIGNQSGTGVWLITHERNSAIFLVTPVTASGVDINNSASVDFTADGMPSIIASNLSYSETAGKIAVSPQDTSKNVHLLNFSNVTGTLAYDTTVVNSATFDVNADPADRYSLYDTEWSPDGTKLYISRHGSAGQQGMVYQYDLNNPSVTLAPILPANVYRSYGLQRGPDDIIYHIYQSNPGGPLLTGSILDADSVANLTTYIQQPFGNINFNGRQFPATLPYQIPDFDTFGFEVLGTCYGTNTKFYPLVEPQANVYQWDFGDGTTSNLISPIHRYDQAGSYSVTLRADINGRDSVIVRPVTIVQSDTLVLRSESGSELPTDTTICQDETLLLDASQPQALSYKWSDPTVSGPTLTVDTAGYYWVSGTYQNASGGTCSSYDAINVNEYNYQLQVANQWYFGFQAGIDFNEQPPIPLLDGVMNAPEGCAAVSDRNGQILFYTDGEVVFGRTGELIAEFIGGDATATQSVIAIPFPQDETMYYIFTTREIYNNDESYMMAYSILDIKESTGNDPGAILNTLKDLPLYMKSTERLTAIGGYGNNAVVVSHEYGNNTFRMYPITDQGIGNPRLQSIGSVHDFGSEESAEGYMKYSADGSRLAVALTKNGRNYVDLFDSDSANTLSNHMLIEFDELYPQFQVYGVEFSPGSNKLFVSLTGSTSRVYEIRLDSADIDFINQTKNLLREENQELGALQTGPDGTIYVAANGSTVLPTIFPNDDPATPSIFNVQGFDLGGRTSGLGLPNFIQNTGTGVGAPTASVTGLCVNQETTFTGQASSDIDQYEWVVTRPGDSTRLFFDTQLSTTYTFQQSGDYVVNFRVFNRCGLDTTITQTINIKDPPPDPTIPEAFSICTGDEELEAAPAGTNGLTYLWNDGSTGRTLPVSSPGIYSVIISYDDPNINGCTSDGETFVADGRPQFTLGPDLTICQDEAVADLATGLNPTSYTFDWRINGTQSTVTDASHPVETTSTGTFSYTVDVDDNLTGCFTRDTAVITVNQIPDISFTAINSTCGNSNGEIQLGTQPLNTLVSVFDQNGTQVGLTGLSSGSYTLIIRSQISGCSQPYNVAISDGGTNLSVNPITSDGCDDGIIDVELTGEVYPVSYRLINVADNSTLTGTIQTDGDLNSDYSFSINNVDFGTYDLEITSDSCNVFGPRVTLSQLASAGLDIQPQYFNCQTVITIDPDPNDLYSGQTYFWNGPNVQNDLEAQQLSTSGGGIYTVRAEASNLCPTEESFEIVLYQVPIVEIVSTGDGCGSAVQLSANIENELPGTNYSYLWSDGSVGPVNILPAPTTGDFTTYQNITVEVINQQNGCQGTDGPIEVTTYQDYSVLLTSSLACEDGNPITLTANILNISSANIDSYSWSGPEPGIGDLTSQVINVQNEGTYEVTALWNTCEKDASIDVTRSPLTDANVEPLYQICPEPPANETVLLEISSFVDYTVFDITNNTFIPELEPGRYEIIEEALYEGRGINSFGCVTIDTFGVQIECIPQLYAPNAFYPDSNIPKNQTFSVDGIYIADEFQIIIYNKWGEPVFESKDRNFAWDGTKNGNLLPNGTYAYIIRFRSITDSDPRTYVQRGGVTLIR